MGSLWRQNQVRHPPNAASTATPHSVESRVSTAAKFIFHRRCLYLQYVTRKTFRFIAIAFWQQDLSDPRRQIEQISRCVFSTKTGILGVEKYAAQHFSLSPQNTRPHNTQQIKREKEPWKAKWTGLSLCVCLAAIFFLLSFGRDLSPAASFMP